MDEARRLLHSFRAYQLMVSACELEIPDLLAASPRTVQELAEATGTHEPSMRRYLRGLAAIGAVSEEGSGRYAARPVLDHFRADRPGLRNMTIMLSEEAYRAWGELTYTLRTGRPAFDHVFGKSRWKALAEDPDAAAKFNAAMVETSTRIANQLLAVYDLESVDEVVDVGGGNGALLAAVLLAHPRMRGVLFDLPQGLAGAREGLASVSERVRLVEGSFFDDVPSGGDLYLLKSIIHDWDDDHAVKILESCRRAMDGSARIALVERLLPDHAVASAEALDATMSDLNMMVVLGGRERTTKEYRDLFAATGFHLTRSLPAGDTGFGIFEANPI
ncbi:MAG TPA: methyltransferase [Candidatus Dormibacteraeota bacterium]|nr:methyltransferase [Candidatus Dormibacteraeota bacterium]